MNDPPLAFWRRRFVLFAAAMLIIGFALNLIIAMIIVAASPTPMLAALIRSTTGQAVFHEPLLNNRMRTMMRDDDEPSVSVSGSAGMRVITIHEVLSSIPASDSDMHIHVGQILRPRHITLMVGWPAKSLHGEWMLTLSDTGHSKKRDKLITLPQGWFQFEKYMPYGPLPTGTLFNTLFYSLIIAGLWIAISSVRERLRSRMGRCPSCAYDITGLVICPECGAHVDGAADRAAGGSQTT